MTRKFFWLYLIVICHMFFGYYLENQFKQYGFTAGLDDRSLTQIGAAANLFSGCFKVIWATLLDYYNFKPVYSVVLLILMLCLVSLHWAVHNVYSYAVVVCLTFVCDGAIWSMLPVASK